MEREPTAEERERSAARLAGCKAEREGEDGGKCSSSSGDLVVAILDGFVRSVNGAITTFDVPGAGTTPGTGTLALGVSSFGLSTGYWIDASVVGHGFVRYPNGAIVKFDAPGAGAVPGTLQGTVPQGMNFWGEVVGYLLDAKNVGHGFVRLP
jgi:hypothetical protein